MSKVVYIKKTDRFEDGKKKVWYKLYLFNQASPVRGSLNVKGTTYQFTDILEMSAADYKMYKQQEDKNKCYRNSGRRQD